MTDETRVRFLAAIAKQIPAAGVAEVHLFPAIRQGGVESGVAVIALERELPVETHEAEFVSDDVVEDAEPSASAQDDSPYAPEDDRSHDVVLNGAKDLHVPPPRFVIYSAFYRHTLKGPDRGKWEVSITEEADAPLITVDAVVRGVQRRSGDLDESFRMTGEEFRAALPATAA